MPRCPLKSEPCRANGQRDPQCKVLPQRLWEETSGVTGLQVGMKVSAAAAFTGDAVLWVIRETGMS